MIGVRGDLGNLAIPADESSFSGIVEIFEVRGTGWLSSFSVSARIPSLARVVPV